MARIRYPHPDARLAADDLVASVQVAHECASRGRRIRAVIDHYRGVHALMVDEYPMPVDAYLGGVDRRAAEVLRRDTVLFHRGQRGGRRVFGNPRPERTKPFDGVVEPLLVGRARDKTHQTRLVAALSGPKPFQPEAAARPVHGVERVGHDALVEQMPFQLDHTRPNRRLHRVPLPEVVGQVLVEDERQAFGRSARLDEFRQRRGDHVVAPGLQRSSKCAARVAGDQSLVQANRVAGEAKGVLVAYLNALTGGDERFDLLP